MAINTQTRLNQVKSSLIKYMEKHELNPNDQLPSEHSMAKKLGVSRNTIREAYIALEKEGIIIRRHGIGTFVAKKPFIRDPLHKFSPFAQIIQEAGYNPSFQTLSMDYEVISPDVHSVFSSLSSDSLLCIKRLVFADQEPVIYAEDYLAPFVDEAELDWDAFNGHLVQFLSSSLEPQLHQIQSHIRAASVRPEVAKHLDISESAPVLNVRSTIYSVDNKPVMYSKLFFNSNILELNIVRTIRT